MFKGKHLHAPVFLLHCCGDAFEASQRNPLKEMSRFGHGSATICITPKQILTPPFGRLNVAASLQAFAKRGTRSLGIF